MDNAPASEEVLPPPAAPQEPPPAPHAPVEEPARLDSLDLLRGISICGILMVNIFSMGMPGSSFMTPWLWGETNLADTVAFSAVYTLAVQKFYSIFSMLFGVGLALQYARVRERGQEPVRFFVRRLGLLAAFGLLHGCCIWRGDILFSYAAIGALAVLFSRLAPKYLVLIAIITYLLPLLVIMGPATILAVTGKYDFYQTDDFPVTQPMAPDTGLVQAMPEILSETPKGLAMQAHIMQSGDLKQIVPLTAALYISTVFGHLCVAYWMVFAYMLTGMALLAWGWFPSRQTDGPTPPHRAVIGIGLLVGLPLTLAALLIAFQKTDLAPFGSFLLLALGAPLLSLAWISILLTIPLPSPLATPLRAMGRMAFTNYIMQSLFSVVLFHGWAAGLFGKLGYAPLLLIAFGILVLQAVISVLWLRQFTQGPLEWLWRSGTYGRPVAMKRKA